MSNFEDDADDCVWGVGSWCCVLLLFGKFERVERGVMEGGFYV